MGVKKGPSHKPCCDIALTWCVHVECACMLEEVLRESPFCLFSCLLHAFWSLAHLASSVRHPCRHVLHALHVWGCGCPHASACCPA